ncbi:FtsX-like permease family protein [bacterium]|nr:FtsX-like permease family protein [bacterium]
MRTILHLALRSILNRRVTSLLTVTAIALSMSLLLLVERLRTGAREGFTGVISQTDVIAGARSGPVQLLLYSVFQIGNPSNNVSSETWEHFRSHPAVAWTIPVAMGDSHKGFRVIATNNDMFDHYQYQRDRGLLFRAGNRPASDRDVVIGSRVAAELGYGIGSKIVLAHGLAAESFVKHEDHPFTVSGILDATGTPFDRSLFITLTAMTQLHEHPHEDDEHAHEDDEHAHEDHDHLPGLTAFFIGTKARTEALGLQREIQTYAGEPLTAALPGLTLAQLWETLAYAEGALRAVSVLVIVVGLLSMIVALYNSLNERRREMAILRALGAHPWMITAILLAEAGLLTGASVVASLVLTYAAMAAATGMIVANFGVVLPVTALTADEWVRLGAMFLTGLAMACLPAWRAYTNALVDGLTIRL